MLLTTIIYLLFSSRKLRASGRSFVIALAFILISNTAQANDKTDNRTPPVIYGVSVTSITANSAVISWITNVQSTSRVNFGTTTSYGFSTLTDGTQVSMHSQTLYGLAASTPYHFQVVSGTDSSGDNSFTTTNLSSTLGSLNTHTIQAYPSGKIISWTVNPINGFDTVIGLAWKYLLNSVPNDPSTNKPAYYSRSYLDPSNGSVADWPHNPAGLYGMLIESALKYYHYSGDTNVMRLAKNVAYWHLDHGMTTASDNWPNVPYSSGDAGSLTYNGANVGNLDGKGDGDGYLEPDKIGELGFGWLQLYKYNGDVRFKNAAIQAANVLSNKVRPGNQTQSPWPFRVYAHTGEIREDYSSSLAGPLSLLDGLIEAGIGDTASYRTARTTAWTWMMTYPMQNNVWAQYFEDVGMQQNYNSNLNQLNAMMIARYLLLHPQYDASWETHVRGLITWVENNFNQAAFGANTIKEQQYFFYPMGSHTSRYAAVNAMLYEKTGDAAAKEKAYRSFNWASYMCRSNGVVIDGTDVGNQWFTDGYGDYIRHFMNGLSAVPEWTPSNQTHVLRSSSVIRNITYSTDSVKYSTYDSSSTEILHMNFTPGTITVDGVALYQRFDLNQPGWTMDASTKTLKIYHTNGTQIIISATAAPAATGAVCPGNNTQFGMPRPGNGFSYQWQIDSTGNGFIDLAANTIYSGVHTDTLRLTAPPVSAYGVKLRCFAYKGDTLIIGTPHVLKFIVTWQGSISSDWQNSSNWSCNAVPTTFTDVIVPGGLANNPVISSDISVRSIKTQAGSTLTISPGVRVNITGK